MKGKTTITENEISHIISKLHKKTGGYKCTFRESEESLVLAENKFNSFFLNHKIINKQISLTLREFKKKCKKNWTKNTNMNFILSKYIPISSKKHWLRNLHTFFFALVPQKIAPLTIFIEKGIKLQLFENKIKYTLIIYHEISFRKIIHVDYKEIEASIHDYKCCSQLTQRESKKTLLEAKWRITSIILENKKINKKHILNKLDKAIKMLLNKKSKKNWNKNKNMNIILKSIFAFNIKQDLHWVRNLMKNLRPQPELYKRSGTIRQKLDYNSFLKNLILQISLNHAQNMMGHIRILRINEEFVIKRENYSFWSAFLVSKIIQILTKKKNKDNYYYFQFSLEIETQQFRAWTLYPLPTITSHRLEIFNHLSNHFSYEDNVNNINIVISFEVDKFHHPIAKSFSYVNKNKEGKLNTFFKMLGRVVTKYFTDEFYSKIAEATLYILVNYKKGTKMPKFSLQTCTIYKESSSQSIEDNNEKKHEEQTYIF